LLSLFILYAISTQSLASAQPVIRTPAATIRLLSGPSEALRRGMIKLSPQEAIMKAADAAPRGVYGVFELDVNRAETVGPNFFVNSEKDYRDQRNLSVAIGPSAQSELRRRYREDLREAMLGRKLLVFGYPRRVRVDFISNGRRSGKYYFQTHVPVGDARQIELIG
jgi:hypothetical protein